MIGEQEGKERIEWKYSAGQDEKNGVKRRRGEKQRWREKRERKEERRGEDVSWCPE